MSGLSDRLKTEPIYRPYCLNCSTMMRMTLVNGHIMWCAPVRDRTHDGLRAFGLPPTNRIGCGLSFDIETGKLLTASPPSQEPQNSAAPKTSIPKTNIDERAEHG